MKSGIYNATMEFGDTGGSARPHPGFDPMTTPYEVDESQYPRAGSAEEQCAFLLRYVILSPSTHNTQPWRFAILPEGIEIYGDYTRRMPVVDPGNRELLMSVGAAIFTLRVVAERFGLFCRVSYNYSGDSERPLATIALTPKLPTGRGDEGMVSLFSSIVRRHTNRNPFLLSRIPESLLGHIRGLEAGPRTSLHVSTDGRVNQRVGELVAAAERMQLADPAFRSDLAEWIRPNWTQKSDGITGAALGVNSLVAAVGAWTTKVVDLGRLRAAADKNLCIEAPGLIVLQGEDSVPHWLEAGELLQKMLLTLTREGLHHSYFNMPVQVPDLRVQLRALLGLAAWPQILLRVGFCLTAPAITPRRSVEEVLFTKTHA